MHTEVPETICSDSMKEESKGTSPFVSGCPELPLERPFGFPHLLDPGRTDLYEFGNSQIKIHIADGIAPTLHKVDPDLLNNFLDLSKTKDIAVQLRNRRAENYPIVPRYLLIERHHDLVTVIVLPHLSFKLVC